MRHLIRLCLIGVLGLAPSTVRAELAVGSTAPPFSAAAALGGRDVTFSLAEALKKGPLVVYFYPKSFTSVCTVEAHLFAEATPELEAVGASVIGISTDTIETQREFSKSECRDKFAVAADPEGVVVKAYDVAIGRGNRVMAGRTSYVIAADGRIASVHTASDAESHIRTALAAVKALRKP